MFVTINIYLPPVIAFYVGIDGTTVGQHPLIRRFMKGACCSLPVSRKSVLEWDLSMCWRLCHNSLLSPWETFPLSFCLSRQPCSWIWPQSNVSVICNHSDLHSSCKFFLSGDKVFLRPNPALMPKCFPAFMCDMIDPPFTHPLSPPQRIRG